MSIYIVTGCAGFIGSHMTDKLLMQGHRVIGIDNFSTGQEQFLTEALNNNNFSLFKEDLLNIDSIKKIFKGSDFIFHFAANADIRFGVEHPKKDLEQNTIATFNVLEAMRHNNIRKIAFSSTGSVYGESKVFPTSENSPFPIQTSLYGASKLACEGLISAYCESFNFQSWIFRFVSILGERYTHGHIFDFYKALKKNSKELKVLGNGEQKKSYLYVHDCLQAVELAIEKSNQKINIFNLGSPSYVELNQSIKIILEHFKISPKLIYSGGERGWIGDNPFIFLDTSKISQIGWSPQLSISEGITKTIDFLSKNEWLLDRR